jgi:hypothetical protein
MHTIDENNLAGDERNDPHSHWHAFSLVFVALPAIAGLIFENGSSVMTDILLLGLGCLFLYWSVKWPWQYYHGSQARLFAEELDEWNDEDFAVDDDIMQDPDMDSGSREPPLDKMKQRKEAAASTLRTHELFAMSLCFLSPVGVAYLLHAIHPYLTRTSGGMVSNSNLTLFVLAAEMRPVLHLCKLIESRTMHLQKLVTLTPEDEPLDKNKMELFARRLAELDETVKSASWENKENGNGKPRKNVDSDAIIAATKQALQPQIDALNRAVRRYEKKATIQSMATDAKLRDLELRLNDALTLAAAATRLSQRPSIISYVFESLGKAVSDLTRSVYGLFALPWRLAMSLYHFLFGPRKRTIRRKGVDLGLKGKSRLETVDERTI